MNAKLIFLTLMLIPQLVLAVGEDCDEGFVWDSALNRCVVSQGTTAAQTRASECEEGDTQCFVDNVDVALDSHGSFADPADPKGNFGQWSTSLVAVAVGGYALVRNQELKACGRRSIYMIAAGGITTILGTSIAKNNYDVAINGKVKKDGTIKKKGLVHEYAEQIEQSNTNTEEGVNNLSTNQIHAFDYQIKQEGKRRDAHEARESTFKWAGGIYAAAGAVAIYEAIANGWALSATGDCQKIKLKKGANLYTPIKNDNEVASGMLVGTLPELFGDYHYLSYLSKTEVIEIAVRKFLDQVFPSAHAEENEEKNNNWMGYTAGGLTAATGTLTALPRGVETATNNFMDRMIGSPIFRIALSGLLSWYSFDAAKEAKELKIEAQNRMKAIEEIKAGFLAAGGVTGNTICTSEDRRLQSKPACYCFLEDNTPHPQRRESSICSFLNSRDDFKLLDYNQNQNYTKTSPKGCINKDGSLNPTCDCKNNQCHSMSGKLNLGSLASIKDMQTMLAKTKGFMDGKLGTDQLNGDTADRLALRLNKMKEKLSSDPKAKKYMQQVDKLSDKMKRGFASIMNKAQRDGALGPGLAAGGIGGSTTPIKSAEDVFKSAKESLAKSQSSGGYQAGKKGNMDDYNFGDNASGGIEIADDSSDIMKKEYKVDDISSNMHGNLFQLIHNRYQLSGMKRLFEGPSSEE